MKSTCSIDLHVTMCSYGIHWFTVSAIAGLMILNPILWKIMSEQENLTRHVRGPIRV